MEDKVIKNYNEDDAFYSGTDEDYEEFLKSVDGKINAGSPVVDDESADDLGATKTINLQGVIDKFRKTADGIMGVSKKFTAGAVSKIEELKKAKEAEEEETAPVEEEPLKVYTEAPQTVQKVCNVIDDKRFDDINEQLKGIEELLKDIEVQSRSGSSYAENALLQIKSVSGSVEEIRQAVLGITKLSDSIFDLKNAQMNSKNSLESLEKSFTSLKKKCVMGITVISILTLLSIVMSILVLLS